MYTARFHNDCSTPKLTNGIYTFVYQITSVEILECKVTSEWCTHLEKGFQSSPRLDKLSITKPTAVERFPHTTTIQRLTLKSIPPGSYDWQWLRTLHNLVDVDVSIRGSTRDIGRLHVHGGKAEWIGINEDEAVTILTRVHANLTEIIQTKVQHHNVLKLNARLVFLKGY